MPLQRHLHNGLARPVNYSFFFLRVSPCWRRNGLTSTDSVLAYGHRGQSTGQRGSISFELKV